VVDILADDDVPTRTPLASAQQARKSLAVLLLLALISFMMASDVADEPNRRCGPLQLDFRNPCNAIAAALL
jgi:hypothetical protein